MEKNNVQKLTLCALMAAVMCVLGPLSIPIGPVPVSLTNLVIYVFLFVLGTKESLISCLVYLLLGAFGVPVFSGYSGGIGKLLGPTGGYLIGFLFLILVAGPVIRLTKGNLLWSALGLIAGTAVLYAFGTAWFVISNSVELSYAMSVCVVPFVPFDLAKIVMATVLGTQVHKVLVKASLVPAY